jgi:hypothetical protein
METGLVSFPILTYINMEVSIMYILFRKKTIQGWIFERTSDQRKSALVVTNVSRSAFPATQMLNEHRGQ